jgi:hypothetical protein
MLTLGPLASDLLLLLHRHPLLAATAEVAQHQLLLLLLLLIVGHLLHHLQLSTAQAAAAYGLQNRLQNHLLCQKLPLDRFAAPRCWSPLQQTALDQ